jgi:hypothetical protein
MPVKVSSSSNHNSTVQHSTAADAAAGAAAAAAAAAQFTRRKGHTEVIFAVTDLLFDAAWLPSV